MKMTEKEEKGKKRKQRAGNETGSKQGRGRPRKQLSDEEKGKRHQEKIERDKDDRAKKKAFFDMPGIKDIFQLFNEEYKKIHADTLKCDFISDCQEGFEKFFAEGIIEKFNAWWFKFKEDRQCKEKMDEPREVLKNPEVLEGNLEAGSSNIGSNSEGECRPSNTTLMINGVTNSINANPKSKEGNKGMDDLKKQVEKLQKQIEEQQKQVEELQKVSKLECVPAKNDEINSKDVFKQDLAAGAPDWNSMKLPESTDAGTELPILSLSELMDAGTELLGLSPWDSMDAGTELPQPSLDSMDADTEFLSLPPWDSMYAGTESDELPFWTDPTWF